MKSFQVLLIILLSYNGFAQSVLSKNQFTLKMFDAKVEDVLVKIEELIEYRFSYEGELFENEKRISINFHDKSLDQALEIILGNKFKHKVLNKTIIILRNHDYNTPIVTKKNNANNEKKVNTIRRKSSLIKLTPLQPLDINKLEYPIFSIDSLNFEDVIVHTIAEDTIAKDTVRKIKLIKVGYAISPLMKLNTYNSTVFGVETGIAADFKIFKKLDLSTGFSFKKQKLQNHNFNIDHLNNTNVENLTDTIPRDYNSNLYMIDMTLLARYNIYRNANLFFITAGFSSAYVNIKYDYYYNEEKVKYGTYYKLGLFNMMELSLGFERKFNNSKKFSYQIEPFFKYSLTTFSKEQIKPVYVGISFRINYLMKN